MATYFSERLPLSEEDIKDRILEMAQAGIFDTYLDMDRLNEESTFSETSDALYYSLTVFAYDYMRLFVVPRHARDDDPVRP